MGLETVVHIADLVKTNPGGTDPKSQGDDHIRNLKTSLLNDFAGFTGAVIVTGVDGGAADVYTLTPANALVAYSSKMLIEFTPIATNLTTTPTLNVSGLGAKTIKTVDNAAPLAGDLVIGTPTLLIYDGTSARLLGPTKNYIDQLVLNGVLPVQSLGWLRSSGSIVSFTQTHTGYAQNEVKGIDIASAATINLTAASGNFVHITGTTTITGITIPVGAERTVIFDGALTLTHGAGLLLPGAANITTAANDRMDVRGDAAGAIVTNYTKANGLATVAAPIIPQTIALLGSATVGAAVANIDFLSLFAAGYDKYTIDAQGLLPSVADTLMMRLATGGSVDTGANYSLLVASGGISTAGQTAFTVASVVNTTGGVSMTIEVRNANDATRYKSVGARGMFYSSAPGIEPRNQEAAYTQAAAVSGFRLYWNAASNFSAGTVRVYGHRNT
jgi:hypothetical protein